MKLTKVLKAPCFTDLLQWLLLKVSGFQPATLLKKRLRQKCFSVNFAKFLKISFLLTKHLRMTASCLYLRILRSFSKHFFYRALPGNCYFHVQVAEFQPPDTVKNYFTDTFYTRPRSSHPKAFIYLKFLKTVCEKVYLSNLQLYGTKLFCTFSFMYFVFIFFRMFQDCFFRRGFESVRAQFLSGNISLISGNKCYL